MTAGFEVAAVVEDALWAAARERLPAELLGGPALTAAVIDRSRRYTSERERLAAAGGERATAADLAARALFFTVADAAKLHLPLRELAGAGDAAPVLPAPAGFLTGDVLRVLDVGAGCGAMTLGLCTFLAARPAAPRLAVTLLDRDREALALAERAVTAVARALGLAVAVEVRAVDVTAPLPRGGFDLVVAGSVLNELTAPAPVAAAMIEVLAPAGVLIVVEPALRVTTRALHTARDALIAGGHAAVLAPCTRRAAPCPALAAATDWCHDHRPLRLPPRARQLAQITGLRDGDMKLAYLALCRPAAAPAAPAALRVVDDPHATKGKLELTLCGAAGWIPARLLKRHRSATNRGLERAHRGDVLVVEPAPTAEAPELSAEARVSHHPLPG